MTEAALGLASGQTWGTLPGVVPAFLHEAYELAQGPGRARLAVALARAWAYAGNPHRASGFAQEAVVAAESIGDPTLLAEGLDAELLVHWGPDDLDERLRITARIEDIAAHLADVEARLSAHLWRLTTALEWLDLVGVQRQLRALDLLAEESGSARVRFFAASRRGMAALLAGDTSAATALLDEVRRSGAEAGEPDTFALDHTLAAGIARQQGDAAVLAREAQVYEEFGTREGAPSVSAQAAVLWLQAGETEHAATLLHQIAGRDFAHLVRDVEWLLTIVSLVEVAAATGATDLAAVALGLLEPYAGRAVVNAGAVAFEGVVDDYLAGAAAALGHTDDAARWEHGARTAYQRLDAPWWLARLGQHQQTPPDTTTFHLRPIGDRIWLIGRDADPVAIGESKGLKYLSTLLRNPRVPSRRSTSPTPSPAIRARESERAITARSSTGVRSPPTVDDSPRSTPSSTKPVSGQTRAAPPRSPMNATRSSRRSPPPVSADAPAEPGPPPSGPESPSARRSPRPSPGSRTSTPRPHECSATPCAPAPPAATTRTPTVRSIGYSTDAGDHPHPFPPTHPPSRPVRDDQRPRGRSDSRRPNDHQYSNARARKGD